MHKIFLYGQNPISFVIKNFLRNFDGLSQRYLTKNECAFFTTNAGVDSGVPRETLNAP